VPIDLPAMLTEQQEAWQAVFEIHSAMPHGWVLVCGQAVYLHAIERGAPFVRRPRTPTWPWTSARTRPCSMTSPPCW
jgi:hypothetical protein